MSTVAINVRDICIALSVAAEILAFLDAFYLRLFTSGGTRGFRPAFGDRTGVLEVWVIQVNTSIENGNSDWSIG